jgi:hypothetical protein
MYRLVVIPPPGGFFWSQTVGIVPSLRVIFNAAVPPAASTQARAIT